MIEQERERVVQSENHSGVWAKSVAMDTRGSAYGKIKPYAQLL